MKKNKILRSAFLNELDETYCPQLNFRSHLDVMKCTLPDTLEEIRTILLYEMASMELVGQQVFWL